MSCNLPRLSIPFKDSSQLVFPPLVFADERRINDGLHDLADLGGILSISMLWSHSGTVRGEFPATFSWCWAHGREKQCDYENQSRP